MNSKETLVTYLTKLNKVFSRLFTKYVKSMSMSLYQSNFNDNCNNYINDRNRIFNKQ